MIPAGIFVERRLPLLVHFVALNTPLSTRTEHTIPAAELSLPFIAPLFVQFSILYVPVFLANA